MITLADIEAAAGRLAGQAVVTPLIESPALNERLGGRVLLKAETLQRVGAFKFRGAYNRLVQMPEAERRGGVVAFSSGNHAQGVALAARLLGMPALIVMPADAPAVKVAAARAYGAEVRAYDRLTEDREAIAREIAQARGAVIVPPFDDAHIMAGQGTLGLEIVDQARAVGATPELVVTPVGGGGLAAGVSTAVQARLPDVAVWGAEPEAFDDTRRSLASGRRERIDITARSMCDALQAPSPGALTFPVLRERLSGVATVSEAQVAEAMRYAFATLKLVVEPGGVVALAALMSGALALEGRTAAVVLSGGNVDADLFARVLAGDF